MPQSASARIMMMKKKEHEKEHGKNGMPEEKDMPKKKHAGKMPKTPKHKGKKQMYA